MKYQYICLIIIFRCFTAFAEPRISNALQPVHYFTDREEYFNEIKHHFLDGENTVFITGMSGIGKTQLARTYAFKEQLYYNFIWFFDYDNDLSQQYLNLAKEINKKICNNDKCLISEDMKYIQKNVIDFLNNSSQKWLLVFDNVNISNMDGVNTLTPSSHNGNVIVCSQGRSDLSQVITLTGFNEENSIELINKLYRNISKQDAVTLAQMFSNHPFLLSKGSIFLSNNHYLTINEYQTIMTKTGITDDIKNYMELVNDKLTEEAKHLLLQLILLDNKNFSKNIVDIIHQGHKNQLVEILYSLVKYSFLDERQGQHNTSFEIHDIIKNTILNSCSKKQIQKNVNALLVIINASLSRAGANVRILFEQDPTLYNNIIALLKNAEIYNADVLAVMELRKNLMIYYVTQLNYQGWQEQLDWLDKQEEQNIVSPFDLSSQSKAVYAWYMVYRGLYYDFIENNSGYNDFVKARNIIENVECSSELKFSIFANLAQIEAYRGDIVNGKHHISMAHQIVLNSAGDYDYGLLWFMYSKIYLEEGDYPKALESIDKSIKSDEGLPQDKYTLSSHILKLEVLTRARLFEEAYASATKIYELSKKYDDSSHEQQSRILNCLAEAEINLNKLEEAERNIGLSKDILLAKPDVPEQYSSLSTDFDLANVLIIEADLAQVRKQYSKSIDLYQEAERIYNNRFGQNLQTDIISTIYFKIAKAAISNADKFLYTQYLGKHEDVFGIEHIRTKAIYGLDL